MVEPSGALIGRTMTPRSSCGASSDLAFIYSQPVPPAEASITSTTTQRWRRARRKAAA